MALNLESMFKFTFHPYPIQIDQITNLINFQNFKNLKPFQEIHQSNHIFKQL